MIEEAAIAGRVGARGILRCGPEEAQRCERTIGGLGAGDPAVLDADRIGRQCKPDGGDARERWGGPAVGREAVGCRRQVPEEVEGFVLEGIEKGGGVGRDARAPGVAGTASEGQGICDGCKTATASRQKLYSAPIWARRASVTTQPAFPRSGFGL